MGRRSWTLTAKLLAMGATLLVLALASIGLTLVVAWNLEGGAAAVNEAGRLRMQTYRLALAVTSVPQDAARIVRLATVFDDSIELLANGDASRPLTVPWSPESRGAFAKVRSHWSAARTAWLQPGRDARQVTGEADSFVAEVDRFVTAIEHDIARWTAMLHLFQVALMVLAIAAAIAVLYAGHVLVLDPVARLKRGLADVQAGVLSARVDVDSGDEFGELSAGFNEMARTLQALYGNLEAKVREKTEGLEAERRRLADLYQVSAFLSEAPTLDELGRGFARQVRRIAGADASAVRWCDEGGSRYVLLASDDLPEEIVQAESCLEAGRCICVPRAPEPPTRVIALVRAEPLPLGYCTQAGFRSVVSLPVRLHDRTLGSIELFFRREVDLSQEDRGLLEALAAHLAGAIEGLRAAALEREAAVAQERSLLASELHDSIAQSLAFMKIQVQRLRQAAQQRNERALAEIVGELEAGVRESYADVRELLMHFRTRTSDEDIEPALRTTLSKFEHQTGLATRLEMHGHAVPLAADVQVQVLHIIQEALSNVRKHSHAREVVLRVAPQPHWRFEVHDDGIGFDCAEEAKHAETHVGLRIMRERAERIGASVRVTSAPGRGCSVAVELPPASGRSEPATLSETASP